MCSLLNIFPKTFLVKPYIFLCLKPFLNALLFPLYIALYSYFLCTLPCFTSSFIHCSIFLFPLYVAMLDLFLYTFLYIPVSFVRCHALPLPLYIALYSYFLCTLPCFTSSFYIALRVVNRFWKRSLKNRFCFVFNRFQKRSFSKTTHSFWTFRKRITFVLETIIF